MITIAGRRDGTRPTRVAARPVGVGTFQAVVLVTGMGLGLTAPFTAVLVLSLGGSTTAAALTVSSMGLSLLLVDLFGSRVLPRLGSWWVLCGSSLIFSVGAVMTALSTEWVVALVARVLQGFGAALFMAGGIHLTVRLSGDHGRSSAAAIGGFNAAWFAGIAVGPLGGGVLAAWAGGADVAGGYRFLFAVCAGVNLIAAVLAWTLGPRMKGTGRPRLSLPRGLGLHGGRVWAVMGLAATGQVVRSSIAMTMVPLSAESAGMKSTALGGTLFALAVSDIAVMAWGSRWSERHGRRPLLVGSLLWGAVLTTVLALFQLPAPLVAACALGLGVTVGATWTLPTAMAVDLMADAESAVSAYRIASDIGMVVGGVLAALALATVGLSGSLLGATGVLLVGLLLALLVGETRSPASSKGLPAHVPALD